MAKSMSVAWRVSAAVEPPSLQRERRHRRWVFPVGRPEPEIPRLVFRYNFFFAWLQHMEKN